MLNPTAKFATLIDGETTYRLVWTFNALCQAEQLTGQNLLKSLDMRDMSISSVRALLFSALLKFHSKVTLDQAGDILQRCGVPSAVQAVIAAWVASQPEEPDSKNDVAE